MKIFRKSLKKKQVEKKEFNEFIEEFGIDKNAKLHPDSRFYRGDILTEKEILTKFIKHRIIRDSIICRFIGKLMIYWYNFNDPDSYYASYKFELIDKDQWQLCWFDRVDYP